MNLHETEAMEFASPPYIKNEKNVASCYASESRLKLWPNGSVRMNGKWGLAAFCFHDMM